MRFLSITAIQANFVLSHAAIVSQFAASSRLTGTSFGIPGQQTTYDYIIIGGGLAGSVIAGRLTEHTDATVAVVEAGSFYEITNGNWSQVPYFSEKWAGSDVDEYNPLVDWGLQTTMQVNGEAIHYAQGRNLGGSSGRNQMLYHRPTKGYYAQVAEHVGDLSYTWDNMTTYLERSMTFTPPLKNNKAGDINYNASAFLPHGNMSNPLQVSYTAFTYDLAEYAPLAFDAIGLHPQAGLSSGILHGYAEWTSTIDPNTGVRSSAESSFLTEAFKRESFTAYINTLVQNIIFNGTIATGVNVTSSPAGTPTKYYSLTARKEVIVAAGAYHSPQILMLSGIGPAAVLSDHGIPIISPLEGVGQNMWDTTNLGGVVYEINDTFLTTSEVQSDSTLYKEATKDFLTSGTGPLTSIGSDIVAWYKIPEEIKRAFSNATQAHLASLASDWPEIEMSLASTSRSLEFSQDKRKKGSINALMIGTASRGNMTIRSNSILDRPILSPNWLLRAEDQEVAVASFKLARQAWTAIPEGVKIGDELFPGKNVKTDEDLLEAIKGNVAAIHHASASCAMGKSDNPMAVVDSQGRVFGVQGLRVVDSSALPFTPPGHTQGVTYGHAEKMADVIINDRG